MDSSQRELQNQLVSKIIDGTDTSRGRRNKVPFMIGTDRNAAVCSNFNPGPGSYTPTSSFDSRMVSNLSNSGYYVVFEGGRLKKKKQQFFADQKERIENENTRNAPGPGSYFSSTLNKTVSRPLRPRKLAASFMRNAEVTLRPQPSLGPGSYEVGSSFRKSRAKGIPKWNKASPERLVREPKKTLMQQEIEELKIAHDKDLVELEKYNELKAQYIFSSKVPRFEHQAEKHVGAVERVELKRQVQDNNTNIIIERKIK